METIALQALRLDFISNFRCLFKSNIMINKDKKIAEEAKVIRKIKTSNQDSQFLPKGAVRSGSTASK